MIKQITTYIGTQAGLTIGTDLFAGFRPSNAPDECVTILETGGGKPDFYLPDSVEKMIQVLTRGKTYFSARDLADSVYEKLHGKAGIALPVVDAKSFYVNTIDALQVPQFIGIDEKGRIEFSANFIFRIQGG